jgi:hypothetical protein
LVRKPEQPAEVRKKDRHDNVVVGEVVKEPEAKMLGRRNLAVLNETVNVREQKPEQNYYDSLN